MLTLGSLKHRRSINRFESPCYLADRVLLCSCPFRQTNALDIVKNLGNIMKQFLTENERKKSHIWLCFASAFTAIVAPV